MKLYLVGLARGAELPASLQINDRIDERRLFPRFCDAAGLRHRDDVRRRFFHYAEAVEFELPEDDGLPRTRCSRQYEPFHAAMLARLRAPLIVCPSYAQPAPRRPAASSTELLSVRIAR